MENKIFQIEEGCRPLIEAFCCEGYMAPKDEGYVWTGRIRPKMEALGFWEKRNLVSFKPHSKYDEHLKQITHLNKTYLNAYQKSLDKRSIQPLIKFVKSNSFNLRFAGPARESVVPIIGIQMLFTQASQAWRETLKAGNQPENRMYIERENAFKLCPNAVNFLFKIEFEKLIVIFKPNYDRMPEPEKVYTLSWSGE